MKYIYIVIVFCFVSCAQKEKELTAQQIVDKSIVNSGLDKVANATISFDFRDQSYTATRKNGLYTLTRTKDAVTDVLTNSGFTRKIDKENIQLTDSIANLYANAVNSVHYFSVLPFSLNDKAVFKKKLKSVTIKGKNYYKIQVTFSENGGGDDFDDVFIYWFNKQTFLLEYLAYAYHTNGGGIRFRDIKNEEMVNGIRFVDYNNYKPKNKSVTVENIDKAFENNQLEKISKIVLQNVKVDLF